MFWTEGVQVIRQMNGVLFREGRARGIVITTASNFTKGAVREASTRKSTNEQYEMKLLSFPDIVSMLRLPSVEPGSRGSPFWTRATSKSTYRLGLTGLGRVAKQQ